jgi:hypothetical protein
MRDPRPVEIRGSVGKLILFSLAGLPLYAGPVMVVVSVVMLALGEFDKVVRLWRNLWFVGIPFTMVCYAWYRIWRSTLASEPFLQLLPEGLVMPSLGSAQPIPWKDVVALPQGIKAPGFLLKLKVDPKVHNRILGSRIFRKLRWRSDRADMSVGGMLDMSSSDIYDEINLFRYWDQERRKLAEVHPPNPDNHRDPSLLERATA